MELYTESAESFLTELILKKKKVDYIFTVPPDFNEINLIPSIQKDYNKYLCFLKNIFEKTKQISSLITVGITDRKFKSTIIPKHIIIINLFNDWDFILHKIWIKRKTDLFRMPYTHIMTFSNGKPKCRENKGLFLQDVLIYPEKKYQGFAYGISEQVVSIHIKALSKFGDTILDCFLGSGTTGVAAKKLERKFIGCDINPKYIKLARQRIISTKIPFLK